MHDYALLLIALLFSSVRLSASADPLFDFGTEGSHTSLAAADDGSSDAIIFSTPFLFYGSSQTSVFVSMLLKSVSSFDVSVVTRYVRRPASTDHVCFSSPLYLSCCGVDVQLDVFPCNPPNLFALTVLDLLSIV